MLLEPWLTNVDATVLPRPWVKWSYQPARAEDVPAAFMRAYAVAMQPPQAPVGLPAMWLLPTVRPNQAAADPSWDAPLS